MPKSLVVLSLCDGMSCGHIALDKVGFKVDKYFAAEIKKNAIKVTKYNYPNTIHIGDVNKITYKDGILYTEVGDFVTDIDIVMFGSPCQSFSIAMRADMRIGLDDDMRSGLFKQCYRILKEVSPKYFLMENVASMRDEDRDYISHLLGVRPIMIDAALITPILRKRYYWTNIKGVTQPKSRKCDLSDILVSGYTDRIKGRTLLASDGNISKNPCKMFYRYYLTGFTTCVFKSELHYISCVKELERVMSGKTNPTIAVLDNYTGTVFDGIRYMNQNKLERCQGVPQGYTKCLSRNAAANVLGDGWSVPVITHIFSFMRFDD